MLLDCLLYTDCEIVRKLIKDKYTLGPFTKLSNLNEF